MRISRKGLLLISLPLVFELTVFALLSYQLNQSEQAIRQLVNSREILAMDDKVQRAYTCSLCSTFLYAGTKLDSFKMRREIAAREVATSLAEMHELVANSGDREYVQQSAGMLRRVLKMERRWMRMDLSRWFRPGSQDFVKNMMFLHRKRSFSRLMERELATTREMVKARLTAVQTSYNIIGISLVLIVGLAVWLSQFFSRSIAVRLLNVMQNTINLSRRKPLNMPVSGNDEIAMLDQSVYRSAAEILELEQYREQLTAIISHELKTPLTSLRLVLLMLADGHFGQLSELASAHLNEAVYESDIVINLIQDLLFLERIESGKFVPEPKETDFATLINTSLEPLADLEKHREIKLNCQIVDASVNTDADSLSRSIRCGLFSLISFIEPNSEIFLETNNLGTHLLLTARSSNTSKKNIQAEKEMNLPLILSKSLADKLGAKWHFSEDPLTIIWQIPLQAADLPAVDGAPDIPAELALIGSRQQLKANKKRFGLNMNLKEKGMILVMVPIVFLVCSLGTFAYVMQETNSELKKQFEARDILTEVAQAELLKWDSLVQASLMAGFPGDDKIADEYGHDKEKLETCFSTLEDMAKASPEHKKFIDIYLKIAKKTLDISDELVLSGLTDFDKMLESMAQLRVECKAYGYNTKDAWGLEDKLISEEREKLDRSVVASNLKRQNLEAALNGIFLLSFPIAIILAMYFNRNMIREINNVVANSQHLLKNEPLSQPLPGSDEIAVLDDYFYSVAQKLMSLREFKQKLVAVVRGEFKEPLEHISVALETVSREDAASLSQKARDRIAMAQKELRRLMKLLDELLGIGSLQVGQIDLNIAEAHLKEIMERSVTIVKPLADQRKITVKMNPLDLTFAADADRLIQVLVNLMSNAIKFSPQDGIVTLDAALIDQTLSIKVIDQGRGIPEKLQTVIFEPFEQVEKADASEKKGTGLGLFIVKSIVESHGGQIGVESEEGKGACFWIRLPIKADVQKKDLVEAMSN